jgi:hypothetical protein
MRPIEGVVVDVDFGLYRKTREVIYSSEGETLTRVALTEGGCQCGSVVLAYRRHGRRYTVLELSDYGAPKLMLRIETDHRPWRVLLKTKVELSRAQAEEIRRRMLEVGSVGGFMELIYYIVGGLVYGL